MNTNQMWKYICEQEDRIVKLEGKIKKQSSAIVTLKGRFTKLAKEVKKEDKE